MDDVQRLKDLAVSDSGFVFDPYSGTTFSVNATGRSIIESLKVGQDREKVLSSLEEQFEIDGGDLIRDIDEFVRQMRHNGLLSREFQF